MLTTAEYAESPTFRPASGRFGSFLRGTDLALMATVTAVPEISRFYGIVIGMYFEEHGRPHFHARVGDFRISVEIESEAVRGDFPPAALSKVLDWAARHRVELMDNWNRARLGEPLVPVPPLP